MLPSPTARKLSAVASQGRQAVVVGNRAESEPASNKDRTLLNLRSQLVLDGAVLAARAVGADYIVIYIHSNDAPLSPVVQHAIGERTNSLSGEPVIMLVHPPNSFLAGESTAVVSSINGGHAKPAFGQRNAIAV